MRQGERPLVRILVGLTLATLLAGCSVIQEALDQPEMSAIRGRLEKAKVTIEFHDFGSPSPSAQTKVDLTDGTIRVWINKGLEGKPVKVVKQHLAHEEVHVSAPPADRWRFENERDARVQEADIWRLVKGALEDLTCDDNDRLIYRPDGSRRPDAEVRKILRESGYGF